MERIEEATKGIQRIQNTIDRLLDSIKDIDSDFPKNIAKEPYKDFLSALADDLNTPKALAGIFETIRYINLSLEKNDLDIEQKLDFLRYFKKINELLDVLHFESGKLIDDREIEDLIEKRKIARQEKNFKLSDEIRDELISRGILLEDTKTGVKWKRK